MRSRARPWFRDPAQRFREETALAEFGLGFARATFPTHEDYASAIVARHGQTWTADYGRGVAERKTP